MREFAGRRGEIIKQSQQEKRQLRHEMSRGVKEEFRRNTRKYERKLLKDDTKLYQEFGIRQSQRGNRAGLGEKEQAEARHTAWRKIQKEMREQEREAKRDIERKLRSIDIRRDEQIKTMRDQLRGELYNPAA